MKPATRDWLKKSTGDQQTALRELRARHRPNYDAVCFHAQQSLDLLSRYAVFFRYPGESATKKDAQAAVRAMQRLRDLLGPILS